MTFKIYTLGCKVNTYESNVIMESLTQCGMHEDKDNPDIIIINTCTVTNTADSKSMKMIHHAHRENPEAMICVVGCMSQIRFGEIKNLPNVAIVLGNRYKSKIPEFIREYCQDRKQIVMVDDMNAAPFETMRLQNFNRTRAFVKIEDGCENFCSYCIIPYSRGKVRSKDVMDVIDEVRTLVRMGHKEIVLTGIHTGHYGTDLAHVTFADLLAKLVEIPGLFRIRISSIEMNEITDEVLELLKKYPILVDHMHIPIQSGSDPILKAMARKYTVQEFEDKIKKIRDVRPNISITTDVIVGFPGESEELFQETLDTLKRISFSKIHVFPFSKRAGTKAASMKDIPGNIKKERVHKVLTLSKELELKYMKQFLNKTLSVIPEVEKDGYYIGHTGNYLMVKVPKESDNKESILSVTLTDIEYPYILGEIKKEK